jgi:hypothetical protein
MMVSLDMTAWKGHLKSGHTDGQERDGRIILKWLLRGPFEKFVDWRQCPAIMQREAVTVNAKL